MEDQMIRFIVGALRKEEDFLEERVVAGPGIEPGTHGFSILNHLAFFLGKRLISHSLAETHHKLTTL